MSICAIALYTFLHGKLTENMLCFQSFLANWGRSDAINDCASESWGRSAVTLCQQQSNMRLPKQLLATITWCGINPGRSIFPTQFCRTIQWYHLSLGHIWHHRQIDNMSMIFYHAQPRKVVEAVFMPCAPVSTWCPLTNCHDIHLVSNEPQWHHRGSIKALCCTSAIQKRPMRTSQQNVRRFTRYQSLSWFHQNLVELVRLDNRSSHNKCECVHITRYPRPVSCVYDQEEESIGWAINARKACYSTSYNDY
jgi:hypothetical protein